MSWQPSFYGTTASGGGHPPTACVGQNLAHLPVSRPAMRSGDAGLIHPNGIGAIWQILPLRENGYQTITRHFATSRG